MVINHKIYLLTERKAEIKPVSHTRSPANIFSASLKDITSPNATSFLPTDQLPSAGDAECCYPLKEEGYRSLLASASGGLLSFPVAYLFVSLFGRRWSISVSYLAVTIFLFVEELGDHPRYRLMNYSSEFLNLIWWDHIARQLTVPSKY
ncbi:unnamed protein product [Schistocephalus solidus]|uniref:Solute carrier family 40 protein n=1 Tax=Schistocephalus solidus TaxID=70667 RepID=A0A183TEV7_SCHSO|nr:unnamed protein product [Schistocephalus solidus]